MRYKRVKNKYIHTNKVTLAEVIRSFPSSHQRNCHLRDVHENLKVWDFFCCGCCNSRSLKIWELDTRNANEVSYEDLVDVFLSIHNNPTIKNRHGWDIGSQYRSLIAHHTFCFIYASK